MKATSPPLPTPSALQYAPMPSESSSSSIAVKDEKEKTIPFLRQLTEMLQNNEELISFVPGQRLPDEVIRGRIIVHDRNRVQSEVLPVYFNHASFASLRRQLSYFSFVRVGKSRQSGVTYTNDAVVDLTDILKLKRRTSTGGQAGGAVKRQVQQQRGRQTKGPSPSPSPQKCEQKLLQQQQSEQQQPEQQQQDEPLAVVAAADDVASAVLSGTLHAAKTNHNLDINTINNNSNRGGMFNHVSHASTAYTSSAAQSSISQSGSSASSSEEASTSDKGGSKNNGGSGFKCKPKAHKRRGVPSIAAIPRKDRARLDRLLSVNNIVPFIHLPAGHALPAPVARRGEDPAAAKRNAARRAAREGGTAVNQKENEPKYCRERATSVGAIDALLALGAVDRQ
eukprot:CAMPEP_0172539206 /NCGR_PEP_ID=MMETSP1067-20121228/10460_1 /TAXON_ID=265564 ORGANISM="Thalassiosira punctigera, Strain Tpunct2005C2" /NCGR_SAMPLE_ID=MMETSP1067 /ASSEMBLY_ACC=CAM_ASM_000444 /LENGTH=394 /DNA_ID=CAMNT_0013324855 /DNA_START=72 /DNA_END=1256 /DNA_ORIENTATION=-